MPAAKREMKVKLTTSRAGYGTNKDGKRTMAFSQSVGDVVSVPADEGQRMIEAGQAVEVKE